MAGSSISSTPTQSGKNMLNSSGNTAKLDVVIGNDQNGGGQQKQNSLSKIAKFKPSQLKNFSSNITKSIDRNKQASQARNEEQAIVKKKINEVKAQNPFANKNLAEARTGEKINIST